MTKSLEALIAEMKAAAENATPGQWVYLPKNTSIEYDVGSDDSQGSIVYMDSGDFTRELTDLNGAHVASANPANVLALIAALEQAQQQAEVADLLREKVKRLESDLWQKEQLRQVYSEKSFELEKTVSSMKHEHAKNQSWLTGRISGMEDALCKLLPDDSDGGDVEPIEQVTRMVADYRKRIAELEASRLSVKLPKRSVGEVMHMSGFSRDYAEGWCAGNDNAIHEIQAAGGTVQGGE